MTEIVDLSQDPLSSLNRICSLATQQERQTFGDQSKTMIIISRRTYERENTSKVYSHCGKTKHMTDTCYRKHVSTLVQV